MVKRKQTTARRLIVWTLILHLLLPPGSLLAADRYVPGLGFVESSVSAPAANQLPEILSTIYDGETQAILEEVSDTYLVVHQQTENAILEWKTFNIGADAWTHFDQQGCTDWSVLNRIYDLNPSLIYGRLTADGKVFLINQNGLIFGPDATVNVHDLVASALNISDEDFLDNAMTFVSEDYIGESGEYDYNSAVVQNQGSITVELNGTVYLLAPNVVNEGTIDAPAGQVMLAAAKKIQFDYDNDTDTERSIQNDSETLEMPSEDNGGYVVNKQGSTIQADEGRVNLFGRVVNQNGLIRAVSTVSSNGEIWLKATETVETGAESEILCDVSDSTETVTRSTDVELGSVNIQAPTIVHRGTIEAPSGSVTFNTADPYSVVASDDDSTTRRIYLAEGSVIDVSGETVTLSAQDRVASIQLNSIQLRDDYGQKDEDGVLVGETISFDTRLGSAIGNVSEAISNQAQTARQKAVAGGTIELTATDGEIIQREGSSLKFNGGVTCYAAGTTLTTKLVSGYKVYDISEAPQYLVYDRILGSWEKSWDNFGVVETYSGRYFGGSAVLDRSEAYAEGADAGSLTLVASRVVLEGTLEGYAYVGTYQTEAEEEQDSSGNDLTVGLARPSGGTLIIGNEFMSNIDSSYDLDTGARDLITTEVLITSTLVSLFSADDDFDPLTDELEELVAGALTDDEDDPDVYNTTASLISAELLSSSGLENVEIYANDRVATEAGSTLTLPLGGTLTIGARCIEHEGAIVAPAGVVTLLGTTTATTPISVALSDDAVPEGVFLGSASLISVAGIIADYATTASEDNGDTYYAGQATAGEIHLVDNNYLVSEFMDTEAGETAEDRPGQGVLIAEGACLDVSGGYTVSADGELTAGDAGTLELSGNTLVLDGELIGTSLVGGEGGTLILHANTVEIRNEAAEAVAFDDGWSVSAERAGKLILSPGELADTGFSNITIQSEGDLTVASGVVLAPSYAKVTGPQTTTGTTILQGYYSQSDFGQSESGELIYLSSEMVTGTSITLEAGVAVSSEADFAASDETVTIAENAQVVVSPQGGITLEAPAVEIAGSLAALGGDISVTATLGDIDIADSASLDVSGTLIPGSLNDIEGEAAQYTPVDAGTVTLSATLGSILLQDESMIDISGSLAADYHLVQSDFSITTVTTAGDPGTLVLEYLDLLRISSDNILADAELADQTGATLTIHRTSTTEALDVSNPATTTSTADADAQGDDDGAQESLLALLADKFDAVTLQSDCALTFSSDLELSFGRQLVLDAPVIQAEEGVTAVTLSAPWITVTNTYEELKSVSDPETGDAQLTLNATGDDYGWLNVTGDICISGFDTVELQSDGDMVLDDAVYKDSGGSSYASGRLAVAGELILAADQVYPYTAADFTISAPSSIEVHYNDDDDTTRNEYVYSAGGRLVLESSEIYNYGSLLAPSGEIILCNGVGTVTDDDGETSEVYTDADYVYLAPGSLISTKGADFDVNYGSLSDAELASSWQLVIAGVTEEVTEAPEKNTVISAETIVQQEGAVIDASGSEGEVFAYAWLASSAGSVDPLASDNILVIVPGISNAYPGEAVYLTGGAGLEAGAYTILPVAYAFLPGAVILVAQGTSQVAGYTGVTEEGYQIVQGYYTVAGTDIQSGALTDFSVQSAEDLLDQGYYTIASAATGAGGTISLAGDTTVLSGTILGSGIDGYDGGTLELTSLNIVFQEMAAVLGDDFDADSSLADDLLGQLTVATSGISDSGFELIRIGSVDYDEDGNAYGTETITISSGTQLTTENLELTAIGAITIQGSEGGADTVLGADGLDGTLTLTSVDGTVTLDDGAELTAVSQIILDASDLDLSGELSVENSTITLRSRQITFAAEETGAKGLTITPELWQKISGNETIELVSRGDLNFDTAGDDETPAATVWSAEEALLRIDAQRLVNLCDETVDVTLIARQIELLNSGEASDLTSSGAGSGSLILTAGAIAVGNGDLRIDGFQTVQLNADPAAGADDATSACITFLGSGSLTVDADLILTADGVLTDLYRSVDSVGDALYEAADFLVTADGTLTIVAGTGAGDDVDDADTPGTLAMTADAIEVSGAIRMPAGQLSLTARTGGITLADGAVIDLAGTDSFAGGDLILASGGSGGVIIAAGAQVLLDAGSGDDSQGDAGSLDITIEGGAVSLAGELSAAANGGEGGSFALDAAQAIANIDELLVGIQDAGFTREIAVRTRSGDLRVGTSQAVQLSAESILLSAAGGSLEIGGNAVLTAQTADAGGTIELYAQEDLTIAANAVLSADAPEDSDGAGGTLYAAAARGSLTMADGAYVSVAGDGDGAGGTVHFRALRDDDTGTTGISLAGIMDGAAEVIAEAVRVYDDDSGVLVDSDGDGLVEITADIIEDAIDDATDFLANTDWEHQLRDSEGNGVAVALTPGIEYQSESSLEISGDAINLGGDRFSDNTVAGILAIRTAGDLELNTGLADNPASLDTTTTADYFTLSTYTDATGGWDLILTAGADLDAVDRLATGSGDGELWVNGQLCTFAGDVQFASAGDTVIAAVESSSTTMISGVSALKYSLASLTGDIIGEVGGDLELRKGIIQSGTGSIDLTIDGDLNFTNADGGTGSGVGGAIRTTGRPADGAASNKYYWAWVQGDGAITVETGGDINGAGLLGDPTDSSYALTAWDAYSLYDNGTLTSSDDVYYWTANYSSTGYAGYQFGTLGIAAMAGGDVSVAAGGDIACQVGAFAEGDLTVAAGGDIDGRYLVRDGSAQVTALGNIGLGAARTTLEIGAAEAFDLLAVGTVQLDAVVNPTLFLPANSTTTVNTAVSSEERYLTYLADTALTVRAVEGSISLLGNYGYYSSTSNKEVALNEGGSFSPYIQLLLPPIVGLEAGGDININKTFYIAPSASAQLTLVAGGSISGSSPSAKTSAMPSGLIMVDWDAEDVAALYDGGTIGDWVALKNGKDEDRDSTLYADNDDPVIISAGEDISTLKLVIPKQAIICAGGDIIDLEYWGQHNNTDDFSLIHAGGDIILGVNSFLAETDTSDGQTYYLARIRQAGPGTLLVQAGGSIDLGASYGIEAVGNGDNEALPDTSAMLAVVAGYDLFEVFAENSLLDTPGEVSSELLADVLEITSGLPVFFDQIRDAGATYSELLAEGRVSEAEAFVARFRRTVLYPLFALLDEDADDGQGDIDMVNSKIKTVDSAEGIFIIAAGDINVGRSTIPDANQEQRESGIFTESGGDVNIYTAGNRYYDEELGEEVVSGNVNVNESRIMTFLGGDITIWADQGDINAGRGSKGALIIPEAEVVTDENGDRYRKFKPPVQGSGIRTLTYDPDGPEGPQSEAAAGDGYIFAPAGEIDAGEAGIAVNNIYLAATRYANVQNIEASGVSVGVPVMAEASAGMDALAGSGSDLSSIVSASDESITGSAKDRMDKIVDSINQNIVQILNVEVVGFGGDDEKQEKDRDKE